MELMNAEVQQMMSVYWQVVLELGQPAKTAQLPSQAGKTIQFDVLP